MKSIALVVVADIQRLSKRMQHTQLGYVTLPGSCQYCFSAEFFWHQSPFRFEHVGGCDVAPT